MKRTLVMAAATLMVACASEQKASAWCKFNFSTGLNITFESSGGKVTFLGYSRDSPVKPYPYAPVAPYPGYVPGFGYGVPGAVPVPPGAPVAAPGAIPPAAPATGAGGPQQTAYDGYGQNSTAAVPAYWYGK